MIINEDGGKGEEFLKQGSDPNICEGIGIQEWGGVKMQVKGGLDALAADRIWLPTDHYTPAGLCLQGDGGFNPPVNGGQAGEPTYNFLERCGRSF